MRSDFVCTVIYVYDNTTIKIDSNITTQEGSADLVIIPYDRAKPRIPVPPERPATLDIAKGIYKIHSSAAPLIEGKHIEVVFVPDKDRPKDPTLNKAFREAFPGVTHDDIVGFIQEGGKDFDLAAYSAKASSK